MGISKIWILISKGPGTCSPKRSSREHEQDGGPKIEIVLSVLLYIMNSISGHQVTPVFCGDQGRRYLVARAINLLAATFYKPRVWWAGFPKVHSNWHSLACLPPGSSIKPVLRQWPRWRVATSVHPESVYTEGLTLEFQLSGAPSCFPAKAPSERDCLSLTWDHGVLLPSPTCVGRTKFQMGKNILRWYQISVRYVEILPKSVFFLVTRPGGAATKGKSECPLTNVDLQLF